MITVNAFPFLNVPFLYANGFVLSNGTVPNTQINISTGNCRDSTDIYQIVSNVIITIDATTVGLNGIDTGALAANKVYSVYVVSDPVSGNPTSGIISLSNTIPLMPFGYSAYRLVGYITTDSSSHFLPGYWSGNGSGRIFYYDAVQATSVSAGAATTYAAINLVTLVPASNNLQTWIYSSFLPGAASRQLFMKPANAVGDAITITGQVAAVPVTSNSLLLAQLVGALPEISYHVTNAGDAATISVAGYNFNI